MIVYCSVAVQVFWITHIIQASDKYWYVLAVAAVILWQCIATDIYAFHWSSSMQPSNVTIPTTLEPNHTSATTVTTATTTTS